MGDARQGQNGVGAAGLQQGPGQPQGVGGGHVVVGQAVYQQQRTPEAGRGRGEVGAVVVGGLGVGMAQVAHRTAAEG